MNHWLNHYMAHGNVLKKLTMNSIMDFVAQVFCIHLMFKSQLWSEKLFIRTLSYSLTNYILFIVSQLRKLAAHSFM